MNLRFIHTADVHFDASHQESTLASLATLAETAERERPDFVALAGDLFNRGVQNSGASGFPLLLSAIKRILDVCPIAAVSGTPTHDLPGCYEVLERIEAKHNFTMLHPALSYALYRSSGYIAQWGEPIEVYDQPGLLILGMPEPTKEWLLAGAPADIDANQAVKDALRRILFGMGAIRAAHPEVPCIFVYHGAVEGASMCNGQLVEGGISIGREDLALVGADYYALGHVHLAQQIGDMPAYYAGSAYPVNWGECDVKGCNLITIDMEGVRMVVKRIPFPHPPRQKFTITWPEPVVEEEVSGLQAWICYRATKEQAREIDTEGILEAYIATGALPGSRVTVEIIIDEQVRAPEITHHEHLRDKVVDYAKANSLPDPEKRILTKADQLEREATESGAAPMGAHLRLRKVRLRGHRAHKKGLGVEGVTIDLDRYERGLISLVAPNGSGKTALLDNMHPYPKEFTPGREGPIQNHFWLRDSLRELWYADEKHGDEYRVLMQIDGANKSGGVEYHLSRNDAPLTNGRKADYEEQIRHLFGSETLFLRQAFGTQEPSDNNKRLRRATKGEREKVFCELAGLEPLQAEAKSAKEKGDAIEEELGKESARVNLLESQLTALPGIRAELDTRRIDHVAAVGLLAEATDRAETAAREAEALAEKVRAQKSLEEKIAALMDRAAQKATAIAIADHLIADYQRAVEQQPVAQKAVDAWTELKEQEGKENERIAEISKERSRLNAEHADAVKAHADHEREIQNRLSRARTDRATLEGDRKVTLAQIKRLTEDLAQPARACPKCGYIDEHVTRQRAQWEADLAKARERDEGMEIVRGINSKLIAEIEAELAALPKPTPPTLPTVDETELRRIRGALGAIHIDNARKQLATAQEAATRMEETRKQRDQAQTECDKLQRECAAEIDKLDPFAKPASEAAKKKLDAAQGERDKAQRDVASLEATIKALEDRAAELERQAADLEERKAKITAAKEELAEWRYLERACGPDGIQLLTLDAMGPGISAEANDLLRIVNDLSAELPEKERNHFDLVEFKTARLGGRGALTRQMNDFDILCHDTRDDTWISFEIISTGEAVWVDEAIETAFAVVRQKNEGTRILTKIHDERDAALDPSKRRIYYALLQKAHEDSGLWHTIVTTHSPEVQEMIAQKIDLRELAKQEATA